MKKFMLANRLYEFEDMTLTHREQGIEGNVFAAKLPNLINNPETASSTPAIDLALHRLPLSMGRLCCMTCAT